MFGSSKELKFDDFDDDEEEDEEDGEVESTIPLGSS
jgi:hypothetical protein